MTAAPVTGTSLCPECVSLGPSARCFSGSLLPCSSTREGCLCLTFSSRVCCQGTGEPLPTPPPGGPGGARPGGTSLLFSVQSPETESRDRADQGTARRVGWEQVEGGQRRLLASNTTQFATSCSALKRQLLLRGRDPPQEVLPKPPKHPGKCPCQSFQRFRCL